MRLPTDLPGVRSLTSGEHLAGLRGILLALVTAIALCAWLAPVALGADSIYWSEASSAAVRVANLGGSGSPATLFTGENGPDFVALPRTPAATGAPAISGLPKVGQQLSCGQGSWAADLEGAFLYRAPENFAYRWRENGTYRFTASLPGNANNRAAHSFCNAAGEKVTVR